MQEIALFLSSVAGVATAAALRKIPRGKTPLLSLGANSKIHSQIHSLKIEKEILTKTISRLYQQEAGLTKIQKDRLLIRYQHQLGIVLAKIEKLEEASKHPDLGPVGDGLLTLMDQKLSQLDQRLYELSSKITVANIQVPQQRQEQVKKQKEQTEIPTKEETKEEAKKVVNEEPKKVTIEESNPKLQKEVIQEVKPKIDDVFKQKHVEITTLTELPTKIIDFPTFETKPKSLQMDIVNETMKKPEKINEKIEIIQSSVGSTLDKKVPKVDVPKPQPSTIHSEKKPKPTLKLPEEETIEDEDDDLERIKGEIMKTLSKLEQAEVE